MGAKDLILRNWQESDAKALYEMYCDKILRKGGIHFYTSVILVIKVMLCVIRF